MVIIVFQKFFYTREDVKKNKDSLYLYGENNRDKGFEPKNPGDRGWQNSTQAVIRGEPNTVGIRTVWYTHGRTSMRDTILKDNINLIKTDIKEVIVKLKSGKYKRLVLPYDGIGTGVANLPKYAPITYHYLLSMLDLLFTSFSDRRLNNVPKVYQI